MSLNNVPLAGQTLNVTQVPINQNFATIDTAFAVDHVAYNIAGQGQHNKVSFPTQNPVPAPQAGICQLYSQVSTITNQPELVFTHQVGSTAPTAAQIVEFTSAGWTTPGWARLPSGILLKWNTLNFAGGSSLTVNVNTVPAGSPAFTNILNVQVSTIDSNASYNEVIGIRNITLPTVTFSAFDGNIPPITVQVSYLIIGY